MENERTIAIIQKNELEFRVKREFDFQDGYYRNHNNKEWILKGKEIDNCYLLERHTDECAGRDTKYELGIAKTMNEAYKRLYNQATDDANLLARTFRAEVKDRTKETYKTKNSKK